MSGRERFGPRRVGGYQMPSTDAVALQRGEPVLREAGLGGPWRITLELVPMLGGRPELFDVAMSWSHAATGATGALTCLVQGESRARQAFAATVAHIASTGGPPDAIPVPGDTPLF